MKKRYKTSGVERRYRPRAMRPLAERFAEKFEPEPNTGCWLWTAATNPAGYGIIRLPVRYADRARLASRVSWTLANGEIPFGMCVLHRCDNPPCVNPEHLFLGTNADNSRDMVLKGRVSKHQRPSGSGHYKKRKTTQ